MVDEPDELSAISILRAKWESEKSIIHKIQQLKEHIENLKFEAEQLISRIQLSL